MRYPTEYSNTIATSSVNIVAHVRDEDKRRCEEKVRDALPRVAYSLQPMMVGSEVPPYDEYSILSRYSVKRSDCPPGPFPDRHPGHSEITIDVGLFSGHHSTIEEMLAEYRRRGEQRLVELQHLLLHMGLSLEGVAEHMTLFRRHVLGLQ